MQQPDEGKAASYYFTGLVLERAQREENEFEDAVLDEALPNATAYADLQSTLVRLKAPTLLIWGSKDPIMEEPMRKSLKDALPNAESPFNIGILGDDPFGPALEEIIRGESIHGHKFVIVRARRAQDLEHCQMVFISKSERAPG